MNPHRNPPSPGHAGPAGPGLAGVIPIPVTTFDEDGHLDLEGMRSQVAFCLDAGCDGLLYPGVVSEFYTLTDGERRTAVETVIDAAAGRVPVAVGVTGASTHTTVYFTQHAADIGASAVMTMLPYVQHFFGPGSDFVTGHFAAVADAGSPVILQNARVGFTLGVDAIARIVDQVPGIRYVKEESNPPTHGIGQVVDRLGGRLDGVFGGIGGVHLVNELDRGAVGTMPSPAFVDRIVRAHRLYREHGPEAAQRDLDPMGTLFVREILYNVVFHKEVLRRRGVIKATTTRIATPKLDAVDLADLNRLLTSAGLA